MGRVIEYLVIIRKMSLPSIKKFQTRRIKGIAADRNNRFNHNVSVR